MYRKTLVSLALAFCFIAPTLSQAAPCQLERTQFGNYRIVGDCEIFAGIAHHATIIPLPRLEVKMPDLLPIDGNVEIDASYPGVIGIEAKIKNDGEKPSGDFDVNAVLQVYRGGSLVQTFNDTFRFMGLDVGQDVRETIALVSFNWQHGDQMRLIITADSNGAMMGGEVPESNERNNMGTEMCTVDENNVRQQDLCEDGDLILSS